MIAADTPVQRPAGARLLVLDAQGNIRHSRRSALAQWLKPDDLVVANDAATLPASLPGSHEPSGEEIEVRLAGRDSLDDWTRFTAVVFGAGDHRIRTEDRPLPPPLAPGDRLSLGPLAATIEGLCSHPRLIELRFGGEPDAIRAGIARHGRPIQYAHIPAPLDLWDVWTPIAGEAVAFEPPSAGFALDWRTLAALRDRGIRFATLTHSAGISSTGDPALDRRLPLAEPYRIPEASAQAIQEARDRGGRIVAIGTTVVRALEHCASIHGAVRAGPGLANQRIGPRTRLRVVDAIVSGTHEPGSSHYQLLRAFTGNGALLRASGALEAWGYRTHEFGDSVLVEKAASGRSLSYGPGDFPVTAPAARPTAYAS